MEVAPRLLREVEFPEKLRGYNPDHVDEFLEQVAVGIEELQQRLNDATDRASRAEKRLTERGGDEDLISRTLVTAQKAADNALTEARERASAMLQSAEDKARARIAEGEEQARVRYAETDRTMREEVARLTTIRTQLEAEVTLLQERLEADRRNAAQLHHDALAWLDSRLPAKDVGRQPEMADAEAGRGAAAAVAGPGQVVADDERVGRDRAEAGGGQQPSSERAVAGEGSDGAPAPAVNSGPSPELVAAPDAEAPPGSAPGDVVDAVPTAVDALAGDTPAQGDTGAGPGSRATDPVPSPSAATGQQADARQPEVSDEPTVPLRRNAPFDVEAVESGRSHAPRNGRR